MPGSSVSDTSLWFSISAKIVGGFLAFVSGVITATWVVANKLNGYEKRLETVEESQDRCQVQTLGEIKASLSRMENKFDAFPEIIDLKLARTQERIDNLMLYKKEE